MSLEWQQIRQLLVLVRLQEDELKELEPALQVLSHSLPQTQISFLNLFERSSLSIQPPQLKVLSSPFQNATLFDPLQLIQQIRLSSFDAAILFTIPGQSPYIMAYCCYLAGVPIRLGQSKEFGGGVLSHQIQPPLDAVEAIDYHLHLLNSLGISIPEFISADSHLLTYSSESNSYATENSHLAHSR